MSRPRHSRRLLPLAVTLTLLLPVAWATSVADAQPRRLGSDRSTVGPLVAEPDRPGADAVRSTTLRLLVVPVYWTTAETSQATAKKLVLTDAGAWFKKVSHSRQLLGGTTSKPLKIAKTCSSPYDLDTAARAAAVKAGYRPSSYDVTVVLHPECDFAYAGLAIWSQTSGQKPVHTVFLQSTYGRELTVAVHELGHTRGLDHANLTVCKAHSTPVTIATGSGCSVQEYADVYDSMGYGTGRAPMYSGANQSALGWLPSSAVSTRTAGRASLHLYPLEAADSALRVVRVKASSTVTYWVEYRRRTGVDAKLPDTAVGVQVRRTIASRATPGYHPTTEYVDMLPGDDQVGDVLRPGSTWTSPEGVRIWVGSQTSSAAWVNVAFKAAKPQKPATPAVLVSSHDSSVNVAWRPILDRGRPVTRIVVSLWRAGHPVTSTTLGTTAELRSSWTSLPATNGVKYVARVRAYNDLGATAYGEKLVVAGG